MTLVITKQSPAEVRKEIRAMQAAAQKINSSKESARGFLLKNGFITADNKLNKRYG
jgi:hypothetical protein